MKARACTGLFSTLLVAVTLTFTLNGCVTAPVTEPMHYDTSSINNDFDEISRYPSNKANTATGNCLASIEEIEDRRSSKTSFGTSPYFQKFAESVPLWMKEGFQTLGGNGYQLLLHNENELKMDAHVTMRVKIHKAYMLHQYTSKSANLALSVDYTTNNKPTESKLYRGRYTAVNWVNSAGEIEGAMNEALSDVLAKINNDIKQYCMTAQIPLAQSE
ncbi:hypothetical protein [Kaarinaea lacus]